MASSAYMPPSGQPTQICTICQNGQNQQITIPISSSCTANNTKSPVQVDSGMLSFSIPLLSAAAVGAGSFSFSLNYWSGNSATTSAGSSGNPLGVGFNFPQNAVLIQSGTNALLQTGDNGQELFTSSDGMTYSSTANNTGAILMRGGSGTSDTFTLIARDGTVSTFFGFDSPITTPGCIKGFVDRFGSGQSYTYIVTPGGVRLASLTDSYGRAVYFSYNGAAYNYTLQGITDFLGRQVSFQYETDAYGTRLIGVVLPSINRGANNDANVFPNGTGYAFVFDTGNSRVARKNDLIAIYYPNQVAPYISNRTIDVASVIANAVARQQPSFFQDPTDEFTFGKVQTVIESASGTGSAGAGAYAYQYLDTGLPPNLLDPYDIIVSRTVATDRAGGQTAYDINAAGMVVHEQKFATRSKSGLQAASWETWRQFNSHNQVLVEVLPEANSVVNTYEDETNTVIIGGAPYARRIGLLKSATRYPGNSAGILSDNSAGARPGSNGQTQLTRTFFWDPIFNQQCAMIEERGNPINSTDGYFTPQNGGTTPSDADRSRYATLTFFDYQKDAAATVQADTALQTQLGLTNTQIGTLISWVDGQLTATDGSGGIPAGFAMGLGDISGEGTGAGTSFDAAHLGNVVKVQKPSVRQLIPNVAPAYADTVLFDGPTAYWRLGESSGTTAADSSGDGHAGTYAGGVTLGQPGAIVRDPNTAVALDGSSGHISLSDAWAPAGSSPRTFECWFKTTATFSTNQYQFIFSYGTYATDEGAFVVVGTDANLGANGFGISQYGASVGTPGVCDGNWHHGVATFDGTTWSIYLDGVLKSSSALGTNTVPGGTFDIGRAAGASYWTGSLDEIAVYPTALSAERILAHYNAGTGTDGWVLAQQQRTELFTSNLLGQRTTRTDAEGNVHVTVRYPMSDPEGAAQFLVAGLSNKQYGFVKETHVDVDPATVMTLLGADADLLAFTGNIIARANTPGSYLDLVTKYQPSGTGGGCAGCAYDPLGNPLSVTDPRGNTTTYDRNEMGEAYRVTSPAPYNYQLETSFDANRNAIQVDTQDVVVQYASNDPNDPRFATFVPTGNGTTANLPTMPGPGGAVRPGWFSDLFTFDLLDNKIQQDIDCTGSSVSASEDAPASLVTGFTYDFNQNLVKITKPLGNTIEYDYDERDLKIALRVGGPSGSVTVMAYDGNKDLIDAIGPATRGTAAQTLSCIIGDAFGGSSPATFSGDWMLQNVYDGFDRRINAIDAAGGMMLQTFDPGSRAIAAQTYGSPGEPTPTDRGGSANVLLASREARFDEAGRRYEAQKDVFLDGGTYYHGVGGSLPSGRAVTHTGGGLAANSTTNNHTATVTLTAGGTSYVLERTVFDRADRPIATAADNGAVTTIALDGAGRQPLITDALGNSLQQTFDGNGNTTFMTSVELCTISGSIAAETFSSAAAFDVLDRPVVRMDQGADGSLAADWPTCCADAATATLITYFGFDSRNNRTNLVDPKQNTVTWEFDGAGRQLREKCHLRPSGDGTTAISATVLTQTAYDANSNTIRLVDNNGGITGWAYDLLDRSTVMTFHDSSTRTNVFNAASDVIGYTDENGSVFTNTPDVLGRITGVAIAPAAGVAGNAALTAVPGTLAQGFQFDGLSRVTFGRDSVGTVGGMGGLVNADVGFTRDSIDRVLEEQQTYVGDNRYVTHNAFTSYPGTGFTFPSGRQITKAFDALYRKNAINETAGGASIAAWQFFGGRIATVTLGNGIVTSFMNNAQNRSAIQLGQTTPAWGSISTDQLGYDGTGRPIGKRHILSGTTIVGFTTAYDLSSNKLFERALHAEGRSSLYTTDSMDRLLQYLRGTLATGGGSVTTPVALPNTNSQQSYTLDGLGNWPNTSITPVGLPQGLQLRTHNKLNQLLAFGVAPASTPVLYDHGNNTGANAARGNGNITNDGTRANVFDALNRLKTVNRVSDGHAVGAYVYDAIGRRIIRTVLGAVSFSVPLGTSRYLLDGQQIVEELNAASGSPVVQYVWGQYIDELIQLKALTSIGPQPLSAGNYYLLSDLLYRSAALANSTGVIVETYDTSAYGDTLLFSAGGGTGGAWWSNSDTQAGYSACRYVFTGREYDPETGLYFYRARCYEPPLGRFLSRDPVGLTRKAGLYPFVLGRPTALRDPRGLQSLEDEYLFTQHGRQHQRLFPHDPIPAPPSNPPLPPPKVTPLDVLAGLVPGAGCAPAAAPPGPCGNFTVANSTSVKYPDMATTVNGFEVGYTPGAAGSCPCAGSIIILQVISGPKGNLLANRSPHFDIRGAARAGQFPPGYVQSGWMGLSSLKLPYGLSDSPGLGSGGQFRITDCAVCETGTPPSARAPLACVDFTWDADNQTIKDVGPTSSTPGQTSSEGPWTGTLTKDI